MYDSRSPLAISLLSEIQTGDRVYARETSVDIWPGGLADHAKKKLLQARAYEMRGLEHTVQSACLASPP